MGVRNQNKHTRRDRELLKKSGENLFCFVGYPGDPSWGPVSFFLTLLPSERETHLAIGFSYLKKSIGNGNFFLVAQIT